MHRANSLLYGQPLHLEKEMATLFDKETLSDNPELKALMTSNLKLENRLAEIKVAAAQHELDTMQAQAHQHGQFSLIGGIHEASVHTLITRLETWSKLHPNSTIELLINSGGGSVVDGLAMVDYLKLLQKRGHHVRIIGYGLVASMAAVILMAADERVMTGRCWLGLHEVSSVVQGSLSIQEDGVKFAKSLQAQITALFCERSTLTSRKLENMWQRKDVYVGSAEALKLGLVDRVEEE